VKILAVWKKRAVWQKIVRIGVLTLLWGGFVLPSLALATDLDDCMAELLGRAASTSTIGELRRQCEERLQGQTVQSEAVAPAVASERLRQDSKHVLQPFTLMSHKPNYILLAAYNSTGYNPQPYRDQANDPTLEVLDTEVQFQISIKTPLAINLFNTVDLYAAYTNRSFWQLYNWEGSAPFRETNHEPEGWIQFRPDWNVLGLRNTSNAIGIVHQSNGRSDVLSRSWNRIYANMVLERGNFALGLKPWYRFKEDAADDNNPDITDYLGHGEMRLGYKLNEHVFAAMSRNNLESGFHRGALELSWSFPLGDYPYLKGYIQYFTGYGESMIDYNHYVNRIGVGFALTDWL